MGFNLILICELNEEEQGRFFEFLKALKKEARLHLEFRTDKDPLFIKPPKLSSNEGVTDPYRRFINFEQFCADLKAINFEILYETEQQGLSIYKDDNPYLGRIVARKF